jgi:hypothetical protein
MRPSRTIDGSNLTIVDNTNNLNVTANGDFNNLSFGGANVDATVTGQINHISMVGNNDHLVLSKNGFHNFYSITGNNAQVQQLDPMGVGSIVGNGATVDLEGGSSNMTITGGGLVSGTIAGFNDFFTLHGSPLLNITATGGFQFLHLDNATGDVTVTTDDVILDTTGHLFVDATTSGTNGSPGGTYSMNSDGNVVLGGHATDFINFLDASYVNGGGGGDRFSYGPGPGLSGTSTIGDFNIAEGDKLNLSAFHATLNDFVVNGNNLVVQTQQYGTHVLAGVGDQLTAHGGFLVAVQDGTVTI